MTTKPKSRKFRIRRNPSTRAPAPTFDDGFGDSPFPGSAATAGDDRAAPAHPAPPPRPVPVDGAAGPDRSRVPPRQEAGETEDAAMAPDTADPQSVEEEIAQIRAEMLTGRQLRIARRTAQKHGLRPSSDFDAVRLLRRQGIDPFKRANLLEIVSDQDAPQRPTEGRANLPAKVEPAKVPGPVAPRPPVDSEAERAREILRMQRDIAARRRKRFLLLLTRLAFFVALPTFLTGWYFFVIATPMYATHSEFVIQKSEAAGTTPGLSSMFGGTTFATVQDSITVQSFLESREAMLRLDADLGFREHFSSEDIDPLNRLAPDASVEEMYDLYSRNLEIGYDPTEGLIRMEVVAADPGVSAAFSEALIGYAEDRVDQLSQRLRSDQMAGAQESYEDAELRLSEAQERVVALQEQVGVLSAEAEVGSIMSQVTAFEQQLFEARLRLDELLSNPRPNQTRVEVAERQVARLEELIAELRGSMTDGGGGDSLAAITSRLTVAEADLATRQLMVAQALQQLETARIEANRQSLYLSVGVRPLPPDAAAYPRALENTLLAMLVFLGLYLMISMTAAILREQVTS